MATLTQEPGVYKRQKFANQKGGTKIPPNEKVGQKISLPPDIFLQNLSIFKEYWFFLKLSTSYKQLMVKNGHMTENHLNHFAFVQFYKVN